nr:uncharacterized protein LOC110083992 isoform X1 [Pogona vitticeps]
MAGVLVGSVSERALTRSVAHRLKYYIDVQRREDSFDSSGVIHDEAERLHLQPACLTNQRDKKEHDFAKIKLEAYLRAYVGNAEDCARKVQKSPEKQKNLEKSIKKMAQDYVPDRKHEHKVKGMKRQKTTQSASLRLQILAVPFMSLEELQRLVSSASKLIVAATSQISPELAATEVGDSAPKRSKAKSIQTSNNGSKQCLCSTYPCTDEARRSKQKRKNAENIKRKIDISNISSNSAKFSPQTLPKPTSRSSANASYLQIKGGKEVKKGILKSKMSPSCTSLAISEPQDKQPNVGQNSFSPSWQNAENSYRSLKIEWEKSSSLRPAEIVSSESSRSSKCLDTRPIGNFRNNQTTEANNAKQKTAVSSRSIELNGQGTQMHDGGHLQSKLAEELPRHEQNTHDVVSKRSPESHRICFQGFVSGIDDWEHHLRDDDASQAPATVITPTRVTASGEEDRHSSDSAAMAKHGSSFLYKVCQQMEQDSPSKLMTNSPKTIDGNVVNQTGHCLLNPLFSPNDLEDQNTAEDFTSCLDINLGMPCDSQDSSVPLVTSGHGRCSEPLIDYAHEAAQEEVPAGSPVAATAISEILGSEQSEEEFSVSSASSSLSPTSLISLHEQMNGNAMDKNADFPIKAIPEQRLKPENLMPKNQTTWQKAGGHDNERQRSSGEKRRAMAYENSGISASQIVYFSQFPKPF